MRDHSQAVPTPERVRTELLRLGWRERGGLWTRHDVPAGILESSIESDPMRVLETARRWTGGE